MARFLVLIALCVLPALASAARPLSNNFFVTGKVFCDTCRAGFETNLTTYIAGAVVELSCRDRYTQMPVVSRREATDATGAYSIKVSGDHDNEICKVQLVQSSDKGCNQPVSGRDASFVTITNSNGIASSERFANSLGFMAAETLSGCTAVLQQMTEDED